MTVGSLFSGIGGFDLGFERAGFEIHWQVEKEPSAQKVLALRWPDVVRFNDVCEVGAHNLEPVDVIVAGVPCQDVSIAGKRAGLAGARTGLFFEFTRIVRELQPRVVVMENVPGLFTSHRGSDFHSVLHALADCGLDLEWRVLDSQYFGLAQRRKRVFLVGRTRAERDGASQVLFEPEGGAGDSAAGGDAGADLTGPVAGGAYGSGRRSEDDPNLVLAKTLTANYGKQVDSSDTNQGPPNLVLAPTLNQRMRGPTDNMMDVLSAMSRSGERARALTGSMFKRHDDDTDTLIPVEAFSESGQGWWKDGIGPLRAEGENRPSRPSTLIAAPVTASAGHHGYSSAHGDGEDNLVTFALGSHAGTADGDQTNRSHAAGGPVGMGISEECAHSLVEGRTQSIANPNGVRRLTPLECERLQGFPDYREIAIITVCGESLKTDARAANRSLRSLESVWHAEDDGSQRNASGAVNRSLESRLLSDWPVAWRVVIDSERVQVLRHNRGKSLWSVKDADRCGSFLLPTLPVGFAQLVARLRQCAEQGTLRGLEVSLTSGASSLVRRNGMLACNVSGFEISALASDAALFTNLANECLKVITSLDGKKTQHSDSSLRTLCCCVVAAISSCIPRGIQPDSSFDLSLEYPTAWTCLCGEGHRGSRFCTCSDSPRYRALGNAVSVPVAEWIARRILTVSGGLHD